MIFQQLCNQHHQKMTLNFWKIVIAANTITYHYSEKRKANELKGLSLSTLMGSSTGKSDSNRASHTLHLAVQPQASRESRL